jgi:hypothetical protein
VQQQQLWQQQQQLQQLSAAVQRMSESCLAGKKARHFNWQCLTEQHGSGLFGKLSKLR